MIGRIRMPVAVLLLFAAGTAAGCQPEARTVTITIRYSAFEPATITVARGVPVTFVLENQDPIDHEWLVGDDDFHAAHRAGTHPSHDEVPAEVSVPALETATTTITFNEPGTLAFICHLPAHESYGMVGTLTVSP